MIGKVLKYFNFVLAAGVAALWGLVFADTKTETLLSQTVNLVPPPVFQTPQERACRQGNTNECLAAGIQFHDGEGVDIDLGKAKAFFAKACDGGDANGCYNLAYMLNAGEGGPQDILEAKQKIQLACSYGDRRACSILKSAG